MKRIAWLDRLLQWRWKATVTFVTWRKIMISEKEAYEIDKAVAEACGFTFRLDPDGAVERITDKGEWHWFSPHGDLNDAMLAAEEFRLFKGDENNPDSERLLGFCLGKWVVFPSIFSLKADGPFIDMDGEHDELPMALCLAILGVRKERGEIAESRRLAREKLNPVELFERGDGEKRSSVWQRPEGRPTASQLVEIARLMRWCGVVGNELSNALFDPDVGLVTNAYRTREEREEFVKSDEYREIRGMI